MFSRRGGLCVPHCCRPILECWSSYTAWCLLHAAVVYGCRSSLKEATGCGHSSQCEGIRGNAHMLSLRRRVRHLPYQRSVPICATLPWRRPCGTLGSVLLSFDAFSGEPKKRPLNLVLGTICTGGLIPLSRTMMMSVQSGYALSRWCVFEKKGE